MVTQKQVDELYINAINATSQVEQSLKILVEILRKIRRMEKAVGETNDQTTTEVPQ
jgi:DNA-binding ferritin-like protein